MVVQAPDAAVDARLFCVQPSMLPRGASQVNGSANAGRAHGRQRSSCVFGECDHACAGCWNGGLSWHGDGANGQEARRDSGASWDSTFNPASRKGTLGG